MPSANSGNPVMYVGTYTQAMAHVQGRAEGIYLYDLDPGTGRLTHRLTVPEVMNPSFLTLSPDRRFLYTVNEAMEINGVPGGGVSAFAVDPATGGLTLLSKHSTHGGDPCYISVDHTARCVLVANHGGGSVTVFPILADGSLGPASQVAQHEGHSIDPVNQAQPHGHCVATDPSNQFALCCDKGIDRVLVYRLDPAAAQITLNDAPPGVSRPGSGPRHLSFHPNGQFVYVINEIASTITAFAWDGSQGTLEEIETVPTLPAGYAGRNSTADIHVHPNGKFVYGSNRGHDSIVIYAIDEATGRMTYVGHEPTRGRTPRNFTLDPSGTYLFAANQNSSTIVTFRIDPATGGLTPTGQVLDTPTPVCQQIVLLPS
jgi:6-phosphogluconolactonase